MFPVLCPPHTCPTHTFVLGPWPWPRGLFHPIRSSGRRGWRGPVSDAKGPCPIRSWPVGLDEPIGGPHEDTARPPLAAPVHDPHDLHDVACRPPSWPAPPNTRPLFPAPGVSPTRAVARGLRRVASSAGRFGSYRPVIAGAKLREGYNHDLAKRESAPGSRLVFNALSPHWRGTRRRQRWTRNMVHGKNRIPYWIDRRLTGLAGSKYHAIISFGLPIEPEDSRLWGILGLSTTQQTRGY